jgi:hypothetical protein
MAPMTGALIGTAAPRDPGPVVSPSGEALAPDQIAAMLPRLAAIDMLLTVMKRGRLASWKVEDVRFTNVRLLVDGVEQPLR